MRIYYGSLGEPNWDGPGDIELTCSARTEPVPVLFGPDGDPILFWVERRDVPFGFVR